MIRMTMCWSALALGAAACGGAGDGPSTTRLAAVFAEGAALESWEGAPIVWSSVVRGVKSTKVQLAVRDESFASLQKAWEELEVAKDETLLVTLSAHAQTADGPLLLATNERDLAKKAGRDKAFEGRCADLPLLYHVDQLDWAEDGSNAKRIVLEVCDLVGVFQAASKSRDESERAFTRYEAQTAACDVPVEPTTMPGRLLDIVNDPKARCTIGDQVLHVLPSVWTKVVRAPNGDVDVTFDGHPVFALGELEHARSKDCGAISLELARKDGGKATLAWQRVMEADGSLRWTSKPGTAPVKFADLAPPTEASSVRASLTCYVPRSETP